MVRQRSAKPRTAVRICYRPPSMRVFKTPIGRIKSSHFVFRGATSLTGSREGATGLGKPAVKIRGPAVTGMPTKREGTARRSRAESGKEEVTAQEEGYKRTPGFRCHAGPRGFQFSALLRENYSSPAPLYIYLLFYSSTRTKRI